MAGELMFNLENGYPRGDVKNLNAGKRAKAKKCIVVAPKPNELFIDIDREEDLEQFHKNVSWFGDFITSHTITKSPSGKPGHYHIVVTLNRAVRDAFERIGLQAILGSDRLREALSWRNAVNGSGIPTCFFEKDPNANKVTGWLKSKVKSLFDSLKGN
jgi:hypothetical protein